MNVKSVIDLKATVNNSYSKQKTSDNTFKEIMKSNATKDDSTTKSPRIEVRVKVNSARDIKVRSVDENVEQEIELQSTDTEQELEEKIIEIVAFNLGITPEELKALLIQMDITPEKLLNADNLQLITLEVTNSENMLQLLSDETISENIKNMFQHVRDLSTEVELRDFANITTDTVIETEQEDTNLNEALPQEQLENTYAVSNTKNQENMQGTEIEFSVEVGNVEKEHVLTRDSGTGKQDNNEEFSFESFMQHLTRTTKANDISLDSVQDKSFEYENIVRQIVDQIKIVVKPEMSSIEMELKPEHLGKLSLYLVANKEGTVSAQFVAQNQTVKEAIESQLVLLKQSLNDQGVKVEAIEVTIANNGFEQNKEKGSQNKQQKTTKKSLKIDGITSTQEDIDNTTEEPIKVNSESQIDYIA